MIPIVVVVLWDGEARAQHLSQSPLVGVPHPLVQFQVLVQKLGVPLIQGKVHPRHGDSQILKPIAVPRQDGDNLMPK